MNYRNYDLYPEKNIPGRRAFPGWEAIREELAAAAARLAPGRGRTIITVELYPGCDSAEMLAALEPLAAAVFDSERCAISDDAYGDAIAPFLTTDRVFGVMNTLTLADVYREGEVEKLRAALGTARGVTLLYGVGASLVHPGDILVYADITRWELQRRFAAGQANWKSGNSGEDRLRKFKRGYFVEWRMADRLKRKLLPRLDYYLDVTERQMPRMVSGADYRAALAVFAREPFRLVPYFAPEVWGGQWLREHCGLDPAAPNYAWGFDGVPEENSLFMRFGDVRLETPAINLVFTHPRELLGEAVHARFGDEFPLRFDFLDTMGGQNLSLQVHPLTEYIQQTFGMHYTQDESYYIIDCEEGSRVYLGLREGVSREETLAALQRAQGGAGTFDVEKYVTCFSAHKHDHFLIPAGTIHCSGAGTMVLEISATPYIFTFKLWDWGRTGLDGKPRPTHLNHGAEVIQWDRTTSWVRDNLVNRVTTLEDTGRCSREKTGLHEREFIETRRYTLREGASLELASGGSVSMCNVVDGRGAIIESVDGSFAPCVMHYIETFIVPERVRRFRVRPLDDSVTIIRAVVRHEGA